MDRWYAIGLLVAAALLASCGGPDTIVVVVIDGYVRQPIHRFEVDVTVGSETRKLQVPEMPGEPISLPASFTLQIPRNRVGTLRVAIVAFDANGMNLAHGLGMPLSIEPGSREELAVTLGEGSVEAGPDAGPDTAPDGPSDLPRDVPRDAAPDRAPDAKLDVVTAG
jgi:hypothetical protein